MSPASLPPLEDDDLLSEILLRLPPLPSSLPRARAVSRRWRSLASDPRFTARFRAHHRHNAPLLGCFHEGFCRSIPRQLLLVEGRFQPALEPPNRVPEGRFAFPVDTRDHLHILGCRHGLVLIFHIGREQFLIWDPVTGDQHRLDIPPWFDMDKYPFGGTVLRAAGEDVHHFQFQVVFVGRCDEIVASVYSSKTGAWGNLVSTPLPVDHPAASVLYPGLGLMPAVMVGKSLYWLFEGNSIQGNHIEIVEFSLASWSLALIPKPGGKSTRARAYRENWVIPAQGGGLGFLFFSGRFSAQLWKRKTDCGGIASWVLGRTFALDKLVPINSENVTERVLIIGLAEDSNTVLLESSMGIFTVHLESLECKKIFESGQPFFRSCPFEGFYTADKAIDGGHGGVEPPQNV